MEDDLNAERIDQLEREHGALSARLYAVERVLAGLRTALGLTSQAERTENEEAAARAEAALVAAVNATDQTSLPDYDRRLDGPLPRVFRVPG